MGFPDMLTGFSGEWNTLSIVGRCEFVARGARAGAPDFWVRWELVGTSVGRPGVVTTSIGTGIGTICIAGRRLVSDVGIFAFVNPEGSFCSLCNC